ncbi:Hypothetical predicted protein [Lecanosticta acicola]|uniref:Uncharacterized protein n=1 Tax=Lecanosticta acicola TaxID=111012 RepID=A0AAI8VVL8_9PEZI|nr:Hypothetical predicted protein [Lecanosticta acicola]
MARKLGKKAAQNKIAAFISEWLPKLEVQENSLDALKHYISYRPNLFEDSHLKQADAVAQTQSLVVQFDAEAQPLQDLDIPQDIYTDVHNTFVLVQGLKTFVFTWCDEWQKIKNARWRPYSKHSPWIRELKQKLSPVLKINRGMNPDAVPDTIRKGPRKGVGGRKPKSVKQVVKGQVDGEEDEDETEWKTDSDEDFEP